MCVLAFAWRLHPDWPVVLAGNRDELHERPTQPLHRWSEAPHVLAGQDLLSGGSWMGASDAGRVAVVTNLRGFGPPEPGRASRGLLVRDFLMGEGRWAAPPDAELLELNPLNLIAVEGSQAVFRANRPGAATRMLEPGLYGLSNGDLDEPWPKTRRLKAMLADWLARADPPGRLFEALADETRPPDGELPSSGLELEQERLASAIFIRHPRYGTRASTIVRIGADGRGEITERRFGSGGNPDGETSLAFG
jgi:uncharacterized protein with NRDE domain